MRVTPISRFAMLLGRSLRDVVILVAQAVVMMVIALPFGLKIDPAGAAVTLLLLALIGLLTAPLSYTAGLILKSEDALAPLVQGVALPLLLLSGILLPLALAPDWLRFISCSTHSPMPPTPRGRCSTPTGATRRSRSAWRSPRSSLRGPSGSPHALSAGPTPDGLVADAGQLIPPASRGPPAANERRRPLGPPAPGRRRSMRAPAAPRPACPGR